MWGNISWRGTCDHLWSLRPHFQHSVSSLFWSPWICLLCSESVGALLQGSPPRIMGCVVSITMLTCSRRMDGMGQEGGRHQRKKFLPNWNDLDMCFIYWVPLLSFFFFFTFVLMALCKHLQSTAWNLGFNVLYMCYLILPSHQLKR